LFQFAKKTGKTRHSLVDPFHKQRSFANPMALQLTSIGSLRDAILESIVAEESEL